MSRGRVAPWHPLRSFLCHQFVTKLRKRCERAVEHQSGDRGISVIDHSAIDHTTAHTTPTGTHHKAHNTPGIHQTCTTPGTQHKAHQAHTPRETHQACTTPDTQHTPPATTTPGTRYTHATTRPGTATANNQKRLSI